MKAHLRRKIEAWRSQADALGAEAYRVTLIPRRGGRPWNPGKQRDGAEAFFSVEGVERWMPLLAGRNAEGWDIYVTPIDPTRHYIVLDDATEDTLRALQDETGVCPAWVQQSSPGNLQAIVLATKVEATPAEQSAANKIVMDLNRRFGDPNFSGVVHPFRMAGFCNAKPEYAGKQRPFVRFRGDVVAIGPPGRPDPTADDRLTAAREAGRQGPTAAAPETDDEKGPTPSPPDITGSLERAWRYERDRIRNWVQAKGWPVDPSRVDYHAIMRLLEAGFDAAAVEAMVSGDPDVADRHWSPSDYARRTVRAAVASGTSVPFSPPRGGAAGLCPVPGRDGSFGDG
mgnify:CR=1 FL=1